MPRPLTAAGRTAAAAVFGGVARVTGSRPLHPLGAAFDATLDVPAGAPLPEAELFAAPGSHRVVVRFSRGFGLPDPLPEILSMAIKVPDAYGRGSDQDFLLTATGQRPVLRHVFAVGRSHLDRFYSTVLPFRAGERTVVFGAAPVSAGFGRTDGDLDELLTAARAGTLCFDLKVATPRGPWRTIGRLDVGRALSEAREERLAFNSDTTGGGIEPVGWVNRVRGAAYTAAAVGRRG